MGNHLRFKGCAVLAAAAITASGCDALQQIIDVIGGTSMTTVELRNDGEFPVEVILFYDDDQETLDGVIQETGTQRDIVVAAGTTESFSRPCDDLQAIIIDDADLRVIGQVGPETSSDLLRDGDDFGCGDTIVFTFTHSALLVDFDVAVTVQER